MATYIVITDAEDDPEAPATSYWAKRLKNNPIAIAQRATGAPRVQPASIEVLTGSGNWVVPDEVTRVKVRMVGGGGSGVGGGGGTGAGGGGGGYVEGVLDVTPGASLAYVVGAGGPAGSGNDGGDSTFSSGAEFTADGGVGAVASTSGVGGTGSGTGAAVVINGQEGELDDIGKVADAGGASQLGPASNRGAAGLTYGGGGGFDATTSFGGAAGTIILEY